MQKLSKEKIFKFLKLSTIGSKVIVFCLLICLTLTFVVTKVISIGTLALESDLIGSRLEADITHLEDIITGVEEAVWEIRDGALYCGDVCIGDGTVECANLEPFLETERKTGTFCYCFMRCPDEGLQWVGDEETGYMEGHYIRVAGSTLSPTGESIVGSHIEKPVADILDEAGGYKGEANVAGGMIYCLYKTMKDPAGNVVGAVAVGRGIMEIKRQAEEAQRGISILILILIFLAGLGMIITTSRWTRTITVIDDYLERIENGELPEDRLEVRGKDEMAVMMQSVNKMVDGLKEKERIGAELKVATVIQASMLPDDFPESPKEEGYDLYAVMHPAKEVGGDLYDFFRIDETHLAVVIADVSGKGVPAALFMAISKAVIKNSAREKLEPHQIFEAANNILCDGNDEGLFVTALIGILDLETGLMKLSNAGHNPALLGRNGSFDYHVLKPCVPLGIMEDMPYTQTELELKPGDRLFMYTDGVTEATNVREILYGEDRLKKYLNDHAGEDSRTMVDGIYRDVMEFTGEALQFDDITVLMFEYLGLNREQE